MTDKRNPLRDDRLHLRQNRAATLSLHRLRARRDEPARIGNGALRSFVTVERQIGGEQSVRLRASGGANVMFHLGHRDVRRVRVAEHDHPE